MALERGGLVGTAAHLFQVHAANVESPNAKCTRVEPTRRDNRRVVRAGLHLVAAIAGAFLPATVAHAGEPDIRPVAQVEGATLRLALSPPDAAGRVDGVLAIDLEPGWKTYWIDPGPVGLVPVLDFTASRGLSDPRIDFPPPERFREGEQTSVGYAAPVLVPFSLRRDGAADPRADLALHIGLCRELCVPVLERLSAVPSDSLSVRAELLAARRGLATPSSDDRVILAFDGATLHADIRGSGDARAPDLFPVSAGPWRFHQPSEPPIYRNGAWHLRFAADLDRASDHATLPAIDLVLTGVEEARSLHDVPVSFAAGSDAPLPQKVQP